MTPETFLGMYDKLSAEILDYDVSYASFFAARSDALANVSVSVPIGITLVSAVTAANKTKVMLSGGTDGQQYQVRLTLTTSSGVVKVHVFTVRVNDQ